MHIIQKETLFTFKVSKLNFHKRVLKLSDTQKNHEVLTFIHHLNFQLPPPTYDHINKEYDSIGDVYMHIYSSKKIPSLWLFYKSLVKKASEPSPSPNQRNDDTNNYTNGPSLNSEYTYTTGKDGIFGTFQGGPKTVQNRY